MLRVHKFDAAIDMIAAGTKAPIAIAAKATPTNHDGNIANSNAGTAEFGPYCLKSGANSGALATPGGERHKAQQRDQRQQQRIGRQTGGVAADRPAVAGATARPSPHAGRGTSASAEPKAKVA